MLFSRWLTDRSSSRSRHWRKPFRFIPRMGEVETLEDRCLLAAFPVTNLDDSGPGSLRNAIFLANTNNNPGELDIIQFDASLLNTSSRTVSLTSLESGTSSHLKIEESVAIVGQQFNPRAITVRGNDSARVFEIDSAAQQVIFQFFTVTGGNASGDGGGLLNAGPNTILADMIFTGNVGQNGGAISNQGANSLLQIQRSRIVSNTANVDGGGVDNFNGGSVVIETTTIDGNRADDGGGVVNRDSPSTFSTLTIRTSTISNNSATTGRGGGIANFEDGSSAVNIRNSTIARNLSSIGGGGIHSGSGTVDVMNATIASNIDLSGSGTGVNRTAGSIKGVNLIVSFNQGAGETNTSSGAFNAAGSQANTTDSSPRLGPLQDNGGLTFTMLPLNVPGNSVVGTGVTAGLTQLDQRGFGRNVSTTGGVPSPDRGAVELFPTLNQPYSVGPGANQVGSPNLTFDAGAAGGGGGVPRFNNPTYGAGANFEIRVALGDLNGDGTKDIITAPGPGVISHVRVRDGLNPDVVLGEIIEAYPGFFGGVFVAAGDITGDGRIDIITGADAGAGALVRVFDGNAVLGNIVGQGGFVNPLAPAIEFFPYGVEFRGGVRVASGDINADSRADIITAPGPGGGSHVKIYSGAAVQANPNDNSLAGQFFAYPNFFGGVYVATGDVNASNNTDEVITGPGAGGGPHVRVLDVNGNSIAELFPYANNFAGGVRVGAVDFNGDAYADVITGPGPGGGPHVRILNGLIATASRTTASDLASFFAFDAGMTGGIYVAGSKVSPFSGSPLRIAEGSTPTPGGAYALLDADLNAIYQAALARFHAAGLSEEELAQLENVSLGIADLGGDFLGLAFGNQILIDDDAAGFGYFVDLTPGDDIEFQTATGQALVADAQNRVDLLTVVAHELAHLLGLPDLDADTHADHLLADRLAPGIRRVVREEDLAALDSTFEPDELESLLQSSP